MSAEAIDVLNEWLGETNTKERLQRWANSGAAAFLNKLKNYSVRTPRSEDLRCNQFKAWREQWRREFTSVMQPSFATEFPELARHHIGKSIYEAMFEEVWPRVEKDFLAYAIEGIATPWVILHLGDAIMIGHPEQNGERWIAPLSLPNDTNRIGVVALDLDGNIIEAETTSRKNLLAAVNG